VKHLRPSVSNNMEEDRNQKDADMSLSDGGPPKRVRDSGGLESEGITLRSGSILKSTMAKKIMNKSGAKTHPCLVPLVTSKSADKSPFSTTAAEQRQQVGQLLQNYQDIFSTGTYDMGRTNMVEHEINTGNHPPIRQDLRRNPINLDVIDGQVCELVRNDSIEAAASPLIGGQRRTSAEERWHVPFVRRLSGSQCRDTSGYIFSPAYGHVPGIDGWCNVV